VFIGFQAGYSETGSDKLYIENTDSSTPLIGGDFSTDDVIINGNLEITGTFKDKDGDAGSAGQILSSTGTGTDWIASASGADNLGNHTATQTLNLSGNWLSGDGDNEGVYVDGNGKVGIGTSTPSNTLEVAKDQGIATITSTTYRIADYGAGQFIGRAARGTMASPSALQADDILTAFVGRGYGDTGFSDRPRGSLRIIAAENFTDANQGAYLTLQTTPVGTTDNTERLRITSEGDVGIGTTTPSSQLEIAGNLETDNLLDRDASNFFDGGCGDNQHVTGISANGTISCGQNSGDIAGVQPGPGLSGGGTSGTVTLNHLDTSTQGSVNNTGGNIIQDVTIDTYGHTTGIVSYDLDDRYFTEVEADNRYVSKAGD
jgi:hypothetical protein